MLPRALFYQEHRCSRAHRQSGQACGFRQTKGTPSVINLIIYMFFNAVWKGRSEVTRVVRKVVDVCPL
ncbi:hypothetical protein Y032_0133g1757 [Ancylostoma ceylanicum]|uniref:Uncharacterized protein n=1 Tax=Ancylostoma ceylanicum TaxID=53326 RepID=A0A016T691_9BILA|nr:hypothetical protein Y032_0133g1757 [Ancylostoma ceylanicum]